MPEGNPIQFEDIALLEPGIRRAIKNVEEFDKVFVKLFKRLSDQAKELKTTIGNIKFGTAGGGEEFKKAAKEVENLTQQQKNLTKVQKDVKEGFASLTSEITRIRGEQDKLDKTTDRGSKKFDKLQVELIQTRSALQLLNKETKKTVTTFKQAEGSYDALITQNSKLRQQINKFPVAFDKMSAAQRRTVKQFESNTNKLKAFDKNLGQNFRNVGNYRTAIKGLGKNLIGIAAGFGLALGGVQLLSTAFRESFRIVQDFDLTMAKVKATTKATAADFRLLTEDAKRLGATTQNTATEIGELQLIFARRGFNTREIIAATEATQALSVATGEDLASSADVVGATLGGLRLAASETARVTDVMANSFTSSALRLETFRESMKLVAPILKAANIPLETGTALLGKLADAGLEGSIAGTGLKNVISKLTNPTSKLSKSLGFAVKNSEDLFRAFEILKDRNVDLAEATELTDERSKAAFLTLIGGVDSVKALATELENSEGAAAAMAATVGDTLAGDVARLTSAFEGLILGTGGLNTAFRNSVKALTFLLTGFDTAEQAAKKLRNEFKAQETQFKKLDTSLTPLLDRYDELDTQTELTTEEQEELKTVMGEIADIVPIAVTEFDNLGNAMGVSSEKAREFIRLSRLIVQSKNADAIAAQKVVVQELTDELILANIVIKRGTVLIRTRGSEFVQSKIIEDKLDNDALVIKRQERDILKERLEVQQAILGEKQGISLADQLGLNLGDDSLDNDKEKIENIKAIRAEIAKQALLIQTIDKSDIRAIRNAQREIELKEKEIKLILGTNKAKQKDLKASQTRLQIEAALLKTTKELSAEEAKDPGDQRLRVIKKLESEVTALEKLLAVERKADLIAIEEDIQKDLTQARLAGTKQRAEQLEFLNEAIAEARKAGIELTEEEINDLRMAIADKFNDDILAAEIDALEQLIAQRMIFGVNSIELQRQLEELRVKQAQQANDEILEGFEKLAEESKEVLKSILDSPIFDAALKALGNVLLKNSKLLEEQARNAETQGQRDELLKKAAEERVKAETKIAVITAFTSTLRANAGDPLAVQKAIRASGETLAALTIINSVGFEKGGLVEGGEQYIRINERGPEFVVDASTTKAYGLDAPGSDMNLFHKVIDNGFMADHQNSMRAMSAGLQPVVVEAQKAPVFDYEKAAKLNAKHFPKISFFKDIMGHLHMNEKRLGKMEEIIYKKRNKPL